MSEEKPDKTAHPANPESKSMLSKAAQSVGTAMGTVAATANKVVHAAKKPAQSEGPSSPNPAKSKASLDLEEKRRANKKKKRKAHHRKLRRSSTGG